ncbi:MAG: glycoside hydrolase [Kiritimatiellae bacterium]|nr:glycoside hydrolase [Kiritimatiellia bacterium]
MSCSHTHIVGKFVTAYRHELAVTMTTAATLVGAWELPLAGGWRLRLDPTDVGERQRWFEHVEETQPVRLPGSLVEQRIGDPIGLHTPWTGTIVDRSWFTAPEFEADRQPGRIRVPFWLQPEVCYVGAAWYQREVEIPPETAGRRLELALERPHWFTTVWWDGRRVGDSDSLSTPHVFDLGDAQPGRHRLTIRVDNRLAINVGSNSHSVSDHTQGNWNGVVGDLHLRATPRAWIEWASVHPSAAHRSVVVEVRLAARPDLVGRRGRLEVRMVPDGPRARLEPELTSTGALVHVVLQLPQHTPLWDDISPNCHALEVAWEAPSGGSQSRRLLFGLRDVEVRDRAILVNGIPRFLRGTLDCCVFPKTGYPPTAPADWRRIMAKIREYGFNHVRFHSWCPPEAAFEAADEAGVYLHVECGTWPNSGATIGDGGPLDAWVEREAERIVRWYGHHPSFLILCHGNEPAGRRHAAWLADWVERWKQRDSRRLYVGAAGWPILTNEHVHVTPRPRLHQWGEGLNSRLNSRPPETTSDFRRIVASLPSAVIAHESGQWCAFPNFDEIPKYSGPLKPKNFEIFRDLLARRHMADLARPFLLASGRLQTICYKEEIEAALRTPGLSGFQLLSLQDFPGQGTALVGVLDAFWEEKGYVTSAEFRRFCGPVVPLARLPRRVLEAGEEMEVSIEVAQYAGRELRDLAVRWWFGPAGGAVKASGQFGLAVAPVGLVTAGVARLNTAAGPSPARWTLEVGLGAGDASTNELARNSWDVWVFPPKPDAPPPQGLTLVRELDDAAVAALRRGGPVLWLVPPQAVRTDVELGFSSVFWNTAWTRGQPPHTLGLLCDPRHPVFASFPTAEHCDWQWWELLRGAAAMVLDDLPPQLRPLVQPIDTWFRSHRLGLLFEARVEEGRLAVCSMDLDNDLDRRAAARQFRRSLFDYLMSGAFQPKVDVPLEQIRGLVRPPSLAERLRARISADGEQRGFEAWRALDGRLSTIWHSPWEPARKPYPHVLRLSWAEPTVIAGVRIWPRQEERGGGHFAQVQLTADGENGPGVFVERSPTNVAPLELRFAEPVRTRGLTLRFLRGRGLEPYAAVAEIELLSPDGQ